MPRKKIKAAGPDALIKYFIEHYQLATQKDLAKMNASLARIENQLKTITNGLKHKVPRVRRKATAVDVVYNLIRRSKKGLRFADIQQSTGFEEKAIRNIIFRLYQRGVIKRKCRGVYIAGSDSPHSSENPG